MCAMNVGIVMPNFAALRAAVFTLSGKNFRRGGYPPPPPVGARGKGGDLKHDVSPVIVKVKLINN